MSNRRKKVKRDNKTHSPLIIKKEADPISGSTEKRSPWSILRKSWQFLAGMFSGVLLILSTVDYWPSVDIETTSTLNDKDAFESLFTLRNNSKFSIYNVKYKVFIKYLKATTGAEIVTASLDPNLAPIPEIEPNGLSTEAFHLNDFFKQGSKPLIAETADFYFFYYFTYLFFSFERRYRFTGRVDPTGKFVWTSQTTDLPENFKFFDPKTSAIIQRIDRSGKGRPRTL